MFHAHLRQRVYTRVGARRMRRGRGCGSSYVDAAGGAVASRRGCSRGGAGLVCIVALGLFIPPSSLVSE